MTVCRSPIALLAFAVLLLPVTLSAIAADAPDSEFSQSYADWKEKVARLRQLHRQYQLASEQERPQIEAQHAQLAAEAKAQLEHLAAVAQKEYVQAPNKNQEIADFLLGRVRDLLTLDEYPKAEQLARLLIEHDHPNKAVHQMLAVALYNQHKFQEAQEQLSRIPPGSEEDEQSRQQMLSEAKRLAEKWEKEQALRAAEAKADDLPRVKISTSKGDVVVELFENEAPNTVANFVSLVEKGFYDGTVFHRVLGNFMAQGGDPKGTGGGGPGYTIACECVKPNHRMHFAGSLSMAHAGPDTGGSQFFLTFVPTSHLDGKHTVFGRVIEGMDVLPKINRVEPGKGKPDKIVKATVLRKRNHEYRPVVSPE